MQDLPTADGSSSFDPEAFRQSLLRELRTEMLTLHLGDDFLIDEEEVARLLEVSPRTVRRMRQSGEIRCGYIGKLPRYSLGQVRRLMREIVR